MKFALCKSINLFGVMVLFLLAGCTDKYQEGYQEGYAQGARETEVRVRAEYEQKMEALQSDASYAPSYTATVSTEVCGGNGVNLNGKHYSGGKTGCVRVLSDGKVEKY
jgi:hypothetical protein